MIPTEIIYYIRYNLSRKVPLKKIKQELIAAGWTLNDIDEASRIAVSKERGSNEEYSEKRKNYLFFAGLLIIVFFSILGTYYISTRESYLLNLDAVDCGFDISCFNEYAAKCYPVKLELAGTIQTDYYEIKGMRRGLCQWYMKSEFINIEGNLVSSETTCNVYLTELSLGRLGLLEPSSFLELDERCKTSFNN